MNIRSLIKAVRFSCIGLLSGLAAYAAPGPGVVYTPDIKVVQGNQPLDESYTLAISSPSILPVGLTVPLNLDISILTKPSGVSDADALSFVTVTPSTLTITGPNQTLTATVTMKVPLGDYAGNYAYKLKPSGWPAGLPILDAGAQINAIVSPALSTDPMPPSVVLQIPVDGTVYTYYPVTGVPVSVPIIFDATVGAGGDPITGLQAFVDGSPVPVTATGIGTLAATGTSSLSLTTPGLYNVRVTATNLNGVSEDEADFSVVVSAPPPTITASSPAVNAVFSYPPGGSGVVVPISFTATSLYGNITATGVTLNGMPLPVNQVGVGTDLIATGSASLGISNPGNYVLQFTASNEYGAATPVVVPFSVQTSEPIPSVTILTPDDGAVFTRTVGDAPTAVNFTFSGGTDYGTVESVTVMIDGEPVTATVEGLGTAAITGSGSVSYSAAGNHTLTVTLSNGFSSATDQIAFSVEEESNEICANLTWLPPIILHKTIDGGTQMPIRFTLECDGVFVRDETLLIAIYEVFADESISDPVLYPYGGTDPDEPDYAINGTEYQLDYTTAAGVHKYRVEIYKPLDDTGSDLQLLGTEHILTKAKSKDCKSSKYHKCSKGHYNCKAHKSGKSSKSDKYGKSDKSGKSSKSFKSDKDCKSDKYGKSDKSSKSGKYGKSDKSGKGSKSDKYGKSDKSGKNSKSLKSGKEQKSGKSDKYGKSSKNLKSDKSDKSSKYDKSSKSAKAEAKAKAEAEAKKKAEAEAKAKAKADAAQKALAATKAAEAAKKADAAVKTAEAAKKTADAAATAAAKKASEASKDAAAAVKAADAAKKTAASAKGSKKADADKKATAAAKTAEAAKKAESAESAKATEAAKKATEAAKAVDAAKKAADAAKKTADAAKKAADEAARKC